MRWLAFGLLLLIWGCSTERVAPRLAYFSPAVMLVPTGETLRVRIVYEANDYDEISFDWSAEAGEVENDGSAETVYTAPDEPGQYEISVQASYGEGEDSGETELSSIVRVVPGPSWTPSDEAEETPPDDQVASPQQAGDEETASSDDETTATEQAANDGDTDEAASNSEALDGDTAVAAVPGTGLDRIQSDGRLVAVVQADFAPFSFENDAGERVGFDIDLVREFARRWLDDVTALQLVPVPSPQRIPTLVAGDADIVAAALTQTPQRDEQVDFSLTYFKDGQRLLVTEGSEIVSVCDLEGAPVAVIAETTSLDNFVEAASGCGFDASDALVVFDNHVDAVTALIDGEVTAFTGDSIALEQFANDRPLEVVGNHFSEEPYAVAVGEGDRRLQNLINATLKAMEEDGTFAAIYEQWFGDTIAAYPLDEAEMETDPAELQPLVDGEGPPVVEPSEAEAELVDKYVVQPGDSLSSIAGKVFGDVGPDSWQRLFEANRDVIGDDPSRIAVGMALAVPR